MKARLSAAVASLLALLASVALVAVTTSSAQAQSGGFQTSGTQLLDANGNPFILRGVSHPHVWYQGETASFAEISDLGANSVRVVLGSGQRWGPSSASDVANVINLCKQNQLICILEVHDTTGFGEEGAAASLQQAVSYWQSIQSVLEGEEAYILINIGNEPYGNNNYDPAWQNATMSAIQSMRSAGFDHTLVVDAPNWGQDWSDTMLNSAEQVATADSQDNTLFSIHMYGVYNNAQRINDYLDGFQAMGLPLMIGEFGHNHSDGDPDEDTIMAEAVQRGIGYIGWSYSGNSGGVEYLDMTNNFNPNSLTSWGERIFNGQNGIVQTAQRATVFDGTTPPPPSPSPPPPSPSPSPSPPPPSPSPPPPGPGGCTADATVQTQWGGGYVVQPVTVTNTSTSSITGWTVTFTLPAGHSVVGSWNAQFSTSGQTITATNMSYNGSLAPSASTSFGFQVSRPGGDTQTPSSYGCS